MADWDQFLMAYCLQLGTIPYLTQTSVVMSHKNNASNFCHIHVLHVVICIQLIEQVLIHTDKGNAKSCLKFRHILRILLCACGDVTADVWVI